jgi:hypothetical protein
MAMKSVFGPENENVYSFSRVIGIWETATCHEVWLVTFEKGLASPQPGPQFTLTPSPSTWQHYYEGREADAWGLEPGAWGQGSEGLEVGGLELWGLKAGDL